MGVIKLSSWGHRVSPEVTFEAFSFGGNKRRGERKEKKKKVEWDSLVPVYVAVKKVEVKSELN